MCNLPSVSQKRNHEFRFGTAPNKIQPWLSHSWRSAGCNRLHIQYFLVICYVRMEAMTQFHDESWNMLIFPYLSQFLGEYLHIFTTFPGPHVSKSTGPCLYMSLLQKDRSHNHHNRHNRHIRHNRHNCHFILFLVGGDWNMTFIFTFSWECHHPNWRFLIIFQMGRNISPSRYMYRYMYICTYTIDK